LGGDQQELYFTIIDDVFPNFNEFFFVHRNKAPAEAEGGISGDSPLLAVAGNDPNGIALFNTHLLQTTTQVVNSYSDFAEGHPLILPIMILGPKHGIVRILLNAVFDQLNQIVGLFKAMHVFPL